jgi:hypothetical protein
MLDSSILSQPMKSQTQATAPPSEFLRSVAQGAVLGAALLVVAIPWIRSHPLHRAVAPAVQPAPTPTIPHPRTRPAPPQGGRLPDFAGVPVSADVRQLANWAFFTRDNHGHSVVIVDKKAAAAYVFNPSGRLVSSAPVLLGLTVGDDMDPGVGDKPLSQVRDDEKTTPAGRFVAELGQNTAGENIVWIDYDAALAMHRVVTNVPSERRVQRLASPDPRQRRISFGCINLPPSFYDRVLSPAVKKTGAIVYVLPEIKTARQVFGSWDVTDPDARPPAKVAAHHAEKAPAHRAPRAIRDHAA